MSSDPNGLETGLATPSPLARPAVRGRPTGHEAWAGAHDDSPLPLLLGWLGIGLGAAELLAPRALLRVIGFAPTERAADVVRTMGVREVATGLGILANPKSKEWVGLRIGGDLLDLGLLGAGLAKAERPERTLGAAALVLGTTVLDVLGAEGLAERRKTRTPEAAVDRGVHVTRSVTVEKPIAEIYAFWRDHTRFPRFMEHVELVEDLGNGRSRWRVTGPGGARAEWEAEVTEERQNEAIAWQTVASSAIDHRVRVTFRPAPGGGTVVTVDLQYAPPGGKLGAAMLELFRKEPGQQVGDDLRRFKQLMETGEVLLSDASIVSRPHPARPPRPEELRSPS
ncbi:MAG TPA: SRPBCC family protein [Gammaproteobacteria bacterium]